MKASEYGKPQNDKKVTFSTSQRTLMICILLVGSFVLLFFRTGPSVLPKDLVEKEIRKVIHKDSTILNIPINFKYIDQGFVPNGDTTYWFFESMGSNKHDTRVIVFPYSHFNFYEAAKLLSEKNKKNEDIFITYFTQISKATYISYKKYSGEYK